MSAAVFWQAVRGQRLPVDLPSSLLGALASAFGSGPWTLGEANLERLRGISAGADSNGEAWRALIHAIEEHEQVRVWPVY